MLSAATVSAFDNGANNVSRRLINASTARRAERGPKPGSFAISATRRAMSCETMPAPGARSERQLQAQRQLEPAGEFRNLVTHLARELALGVVVSGDD